MDFHAGQLLLDMNMIWQVEVNTEKFVSPN